MDLFIEYKFLLLIFFLRNKVEIIVERHFKYNKVSYLKNFSIDLNNYFYN